MINFILVSLLIMPWIFVPQINLINQFRGPQVMVMNLMFLGIISFSFLRGNKYLYHNKYLALLSLWTFINLFVCFIIPWNLEWKTGRMVNWSSIDPLINIILGLWAVQIILCNLEKEDFIRIAKTLSISGLLVSLFAIMQYVGFDPLKSIATYNCANRISACLDNPNLVANYIVLCLPLLFMFKDLRYKFFIPIYLFAIYSCHSHFSIVLALFSILFYVMVKYRKNRFVISGIVLIAAILCIIAYNTDFSKFKANEMSGRFKIWQFGVEAIKVNPLFGNGLGIWKTWMVKQTTLVGTTFWHEVHNDWLERTIEMGVIGLFFILLVVINSFRKFTYEGDLNYSYLTMFVTFLVMMFGSFPLEVPTIAVLGIVSFTAIEKL